ncbi:hypothetical protein C8J57DRAFT_337341 [Mycena rebaudengoi]|nr:hypothetical protein C8J57DRAFT_337341 [Mycena rebaudengoi]
MKDLNILASTTPPGADTRMSQVRVSNPTKRSRLNNTLAIVAASGENVLIVSGGSTGLVGGTSCSSPIFASVIGLLNDELLNAGKPVLGLLNPWLYANPQARL